MVRFLPTAANEGFEVARFRVEDLAPIECGGVDDSIWFSEEDLVALGNNALRGIADAVAREVIRRGVDFHNGRIEKESEARERHVLTTTAFINAVDDILGEPNEEEES